MDSPWVRQVYSCRLVWGTVPEERDEGEITGQPRLCVLDLRATSQDWGPVVQEKSYGASVSGLSQRNCRAASDLRNSTFSTGILIRFR